MGVEAATPRSSHSTATRSLAPRSTSAGTCNDAAGGTRRRGRGLEPVGAVRGFRPADELSAVAPFQPGRGRVQREGGPMKVGTEQEWQAAREDLLVAERELEEHATRVQAQRRGLPWVPVEKEYRFAAEDGPKSLPELFEGRSQLLIYHLMFGGDWAAWSCIETIATTTATRSAGRRCPASSG